MLKFVVERFKEPSSWAGLAPVLIGFGINIDGWYSPAVAIAGGICGLVAFFLQEKKAA